MSNTAFHLAQSRYLSLRAWLFSAALPIWNSTGRDDEKGGFFEKIGQAGEAIEAPRRTRVVCRQIYSFAAAGRIGWAGDSRASVAHGLQFLEQHCFAPDGSVIKTVNMVNETCDGSFDLYDHAFALFGLCAAASAMPEEQLRIEKTALTCLDAMAAKWKHPLAGFEETLPATEPLRSNPHMHLFEACLAWAEMPQTSNYERWMALASELGDLALSKFVSPQTGAVREYFRSDWSVKWDEQASPVEPGHQFEWAWLLARWGRLAGRKDALAAARRLVVLGEASGVDPRIGLVMNGLGHELEPLDAAFRLWPQTERLKAWLLMVELAVGAADRNNALEKVASAADSLKQFLCGVKDGLWRDRLTAAGEPIDEPAPASSLYHVICAIEEMHRVLHRPVDTRPALFLDRDGVLIEDTGYVGDFKQISFVQGAVETIRHFRERGYCIFVVTNQSGIGRGYYDEDDYNLVRSAVTRELNRHQLNIDDERCAPYHEGSDYPRYRRDLAWRKPNPGMIVDLLGEWPVDMEGSMLIGDKQTDMEAANAAGLRGILFPGGDLFAFLKARGRLK